MSSSSWDEKTKNELRCLSVQELKTIIHENDDLDPDIKYIIRKLLQEKLRDKQLVVIREAFGIDYGQAEIVWPGQKENESFEEYSIRQRLDRLKQQRN